MRIQNNLNSAIQSPKQRINFEAKYCKSRAYDIYARISHNPAYKGNGCRHDSLFYIHNSLLPEKFKNDYRELLRKKGIKDIILNEIDRSILLKELKDYIELLTLEQNQRDIASLKKTKFKKSADSIKDALERKLGLIRTRKSDKEKDISNTLNSFVENAKEEISDKDMIGLLSEYSLLLI